MDVETSMKPQLLFLLSLDLLHFSNYNYLS